MTMQDTSLAAYHDEVLPTIGSRHWDVLTAMRTRPDWSNMEIAEFLGWSINRVTPRVHELRQSNIVVGVGRRTCGVTGRQVLAWAVKDRN